MELIRYSRARKLITENAKTDNNGTPTHCTFHLPVLQLEEVYDEDVIEEIFVCQSTIMSLLKLGKDWWATCKKAVEGNYIPEHAMVGKRNRSVKFEREARADLIEFFEELMQLGEPIATRFIRNELGALRDDEDLVLLPSCTSKRSLYERFCFERGCKVHTSAKGITKLKERTDPNWLASNLEFKYCPNWTSFFDFWAKEYPIIRIRQPVRDNCTDDCIFFNRHRFRLEKVRQAMNDDEQPSPEVLAREKLVEEAGLHVKMARVQRSLVNQKVGETRQDATQGVPWSDIRRLLFGDYCMNLTLPFFGAEQPGDFYYISPLTVNAFGAVDASTTRTKLYGYTYHEGEGKKGGNSVASMILITKTGWCYALPCSLWKRVFEAAHPMIESTKDKTKSMTSNEQ